MNLQLQSLLLQPIVENAIKFGLYDTIGEVTIKIHSHQTNNILQITVTNPFDAETAQSSQGVGFGLSSIQRRLFLLFGRQDLLQTKNETHFFITTLSIPQFQ